MAVRSFQNERLVGRSVGRSVLNISAPRLGANEDHGAVASRDRTSEHQIPSEQRHGGRIVADRVGGQAVLPALRCHSQRVSKQAL